MLKDFVHIAGPLGVTHLIVFTKSEMSINLVRDLCGWMSNKNLTSVCCPENSTVASWANVDISSALSKASIRDQETDSATTCFEQTD